MFRDIQATIVTLDACATSASGSPWTTSGRDTSLAYLRRFPVDDLKIAREPIAGPGRIG